MMVTYEDIKKANDSIKTTDIKGKGYAEVNQRIKAFRMVYPTGSIITEMLSNESGVCIFKAIVGYIADNGEFITLGQGTAYEKEGSTFINKTSYIENAETSAIGRACGTAGFGIDVSVASAEEVENAIQNQPIDKVKIKVLKDDIESGVVKSEIDLFKYFKVRAWNEITEAMFSNYVAMREKQK